jgi:hypothetical protein
VVVAVGRVVDLTAVAVDGNGRRLLGGRRRRRGGQEYSRRRSVEQTAVSHLSVDRGEANWVSPSVIVVMPLKESKLIR